MTSIFAPRLNGFTELDSSDGFLKGPFTWREGLLNNTNTRVCITQKGIELRCPEEPVNPAPANLMHRLFKAVGAKKEKPAVVHVLKLNSTGLAQAFREQDHVQIYFDNETKDLALACSRQGQLAFAIGHIRALLPLKGAANLIFENFKEGILQTSLRSVELKLGRVVPLGYYNLCAWKNSESLKQLEFISILRSGVSLTMEDLKRLSHDWTLVFSCEDSL
jgi:hypothetical protein